MATDIIIIISIIVLIFAALLLGGAAVFYLISRLFKFPGAEFRASFRIFSTISILGLLISPIPQIGKLAISIGIIPPSLSFLFFLIYLVAVIAWYCFYNILMWRRYGTRFWKNIGLWIMTNLTITLLLYPVVSLVRNNIFEPFMIQGSAMAPNYVQGKYLIVKKWGNNYGRGDVVAFKYPYDTSKIFIKRIVGIPGETIEIKNNQIFVEDVSGKKESINEPYLEDSAITPDMDPYKIGQNQYFVLGDNRSFSSDSRDWGSVPEGLIVGKVIDF